SWSTAWLASWSGASVAESQLWATPRMASKATWCSLRSTSFWVQRATGSVLLSSVQWIDGPLPAIPVVVGVPPAPPPDEGGDEEEDDDEAPASPGSETQAQRAAAAATGASRGQGRRRPRMAR